MRERILGIENHIKSLEVKRAALDAQILMLPLSPATDLQIFKLKKEKLRLKDKIARLNNLNRLKVPKSTKKAKKVKSPELKKPPPTAVKPPSTIAHDLDIAA